MYPSTVSDASSFGYFASYIRRICSRRFYYEDIYIYMRPRKNRVQLHDHQGRRNSTNSWHRNTVLRSTSEQLRPRSSKLLVSVSFSSVDWNSAVMLVCLVRSDAYDTKITKIGNLQTWNYYYFCRQGCVAGYSGDQCMVYWLLGL